MKLLNMIQTQEAQKIGEYNRTPIDEKKDSVDFRLIQLNPVVIIWKNGERQIMNKSQLNKLQKSHSWATDF